MSHSNANLERQVTDEALPIPQAEFVPPSPVLSIHDIDFPTSLRLRDNETNESSVSAHLKESKVANAALVAHEDELVQEDPSPFRFRPHQLEHLFDPKDFSALVELGGIDGLLQGLGAHAECGLTTETERSEHGPGGLPVRGNLRDEDLPYSGSIGDRMRIYGVNILPTRQSKTIFRLIKLAIMDKMLVRTFCLFRPLNPIAIVYQILLCIAAAISFMLSFVENQKKQNKATRVICIESVAIIVAIAILVCSYSSRLYRWNRSFFQVVINSVIDWHKERQFEYVRQRAKERFVKVLRDGTEKVIDIQVPVFVHSLTYECN